MKRVKRNILSTHSLRVPQGYAFEDSLHGYNLATATLMYRALVLDAFSQSARPQAIYNFGDYDLALFTSLSWKLAYLPISTATYRYVPGSAMNSGPAKTLQLRKSVIQCRRDFMKTSGRSPPDLLSIELEESRLLYGSAYLAGDLEEFNKAADFLTANDPAWRGGLRHRIRRFIMKTRFLHALVLMRSRFHLWRSQRRDSVPMTIQNLRGISTEELLHGVDYQSRSVRQHDGRP